MPTKLKRKVIRLHPEVMVRLEDYKEKIHDLASPQSLRHPDKAPLRRPFSWNEFFMIIISDWEGSRTKCHCNHFYDCPYCHLIRDVNDHLVRDKMHDERKRNNKKPGHNE